ncbi:MAG: EAL domain-containing protein [Acidobacteriaceae bacterium]|nr:EAL domain-containing protein [Acidobacteriaceae bacterium]
MSLGRDWKMSVLCVVCILAAAFVGSFVASFVASSVAMHTEKDALVAYSNRLLIEDERIASNITDALNEVNASTFPRCSAQELGMMRRLLFRSPFLKDVGRLQNGMLYCSAVGGNLPAPLPSPKPDLVTSGGRRVYYNVPLGSVQGVRAQVVSFRDANVAVDPDAFRNLRRENMYYAGTVNNASTGISLQTFSTFPVEIVPPTHLLSGHSLEKGDVLFVANCSATRPDCVTVGMRLSDIWDSSRKILLCARILGGLAGAYIALSILILLRRQRSMSAQLRRALRRGDLTVVYQPIVNLHSGRTVSAEALVRWSPGGGHAIRPDVFVGLAEEQGFVGEITRYVLKRVIRDTAALLQEFPEFSISVNMSVQDLLNPSFLPAVERMLHRANVNPKSIAFELTERSTDDPERVTKALAALQQNGHAIYIDDFGTGYSSLSYLTQLSVDVLKVDRSFTNTIGTSSVTASIVPQILDMAKTLDLRVVVEGVERKAQMDYLSQAGGELYGQGWYFGRPVPAKNLIQRVRAEAALTR